MIQEGHVRVVWINSNQNCNPSIHGHFCPLWTSQGIRCSEVQAHCRWSRATEIFVFYQRHQM